jgi:hypothetical protein
MGKEVSFREGASHSICMDLPHISSSGSAITEKESSPDVQFFVLDSYRHM